MATYPNSRAVSGPLGRAPEGRGRSARVSTGASVGTRSSTSAAPLARRRTGAVVRAHRRQGRVGIALVGIVVAFVLALFSLIQTMQVSATSYDIDRIISERTRLEDRRQELLSDISRFGREPAVRREALDRGLGQLANPLILPAR